MSWAQIRNADIELWTQVALACEEGTKGDDVDVTAFEKAWVEKMNDQHVRACLQFLPGAPVSSTSSSTDRPGVTLTAGPGPSSDSAEVAKLKRRLDQQENQINNLKRQKGKGKGKDKGKKGKKQHRAPLDLGGRNARTANGDTICFNFNRASGCPLAKSGGTCGRGRHICLECHGDHSLALPCPALR